MLLLQLLLLLLLSLAAAGDSWLFAVVCFCLFRFVFVGFFCSWSLVLVGCLWLFVAVLFVFVGLLCLLLFVEVVEVLNGCCCSKDTCALPSCVWHLLRQMYLLGHFGSRVKSLHQGDSGPSLE